MANTDTNATNETEQSQENKQQQVTNRIVAQYVRDLSFENIFAQKGAKNASQPDIQVKVNLDARKRAEDQYEISTKLTISANTKESGEALFLLELDYAGVFHITGISEEQIHPFIMIECPRLTFPFVRRIVSDVTRDGGFPPISLDNIDFLALYRAELARRVQEQQQASPEVTN